MIPKFYGLFLFYGYVLHIMYVTAQRFRYGCDFREVGGDTVLLERHIAEAFFSINPFDS